MDGVLYILIDAFKFGLPYALLALGVFVTYRQLDIADLGCEGTFTLGGAIVAVLILRGVNPFLATLIAVIAGFIAGTITGLLHTKVKIPSLLSGIITLTGLFSINMVIMGYGVEMDKKFTFAERIEKYAATVFLSGNNAKGKPITTIYDSFKKLIDTIFNGSIKNSYAVIILSIIIVIIVLILMYYFFGTEIGMSVRSTGMNPLMSRAQGINTNAMIILGLAISNGLIALGGSLYAQVNRTANNTMGVGVIVIGLASIIIGEALFGKKSFKNWIISVTLGAIVYYLIIAIALYLQMPNHFLKLLYAILIVIVLVIPEVKKACSNGVKKSKKNVVKEAN